MAGVRITGQCTRVNIPVSMYPCQCTCVNVLVSMYLCLCTCVNVSVSMCPCKCASVNINVPDGHCPCQCQCIRVNEPVSMYPCQYQCVHVNMSVSMYLCQCTYVDNTPLHCMYSYIFIGGFVSLTQHGMCDSRRVRMQQTDQPYKQTYRFIYKTSKL